MCFRVKDTGLSIQRDSPRRSLKHMFVKGVKFTWFCVTNFKSSITGSHVNSRKHLFCTSGCISSINLKFSGLYPLIKLSLVSRQFLHKLNFKQVIVE